MSPDARRLKTREKTKREKIREGRTPSYTDIPHSPIHYLRNSSDPSFSQRYTRTMSGTTPTHPNMSAKPPNSGLPPLLIVGVGSTAMYCSCTCALFLAAGLPIIFPCS